MENLYSNPYSFQLDFLHGYLDQSSGADLSCLNYQNVFVPKNSKQCTLCKQYCNLEYFTKDPTKNMGLSSHCKKCQKEWRVQYHKKNKQLLRDKAKIQYVKHLPRIKEYNKSDKAYEYNKRRSKIKVDELRNPYINEQLKKRGFTKAQIDENPELKLIQIEIIKTKRLCKSQTSSNSESL